MRITTRLRFNTIISLGALITILLAVGWSYREVVSTERNEALTAEMHEVAMVTILLRDEFLLQREKRAGDMWHAKSASLHDLISRAETSLGRDEGFRALLGEVRHDFTATYAEFSPVITSLSGQNFSESKAPGFSGPEQQRIGEVFSHTHNLVTNINRLHESAEQTAERATERGGVVVALVILAGLLAITVNSLVISRTLTRRLVGLGGGARRIGGGDHGHRLAVDGSDDEITVVAREFNAMLDALGASDTERLRLHRQNQLILEAAGEGIYGVDAECRILFANPAAGRMLGYSPSELLGQNSHQLFHHTRADGATYPFAECPLIKSLREEGVVRGQDEAFWTRDGRMLLVEHVNTPIFEEGRVSGAVVVFRDITERRRLEEAVRERTRQFEAFFDNAIIPLAFLDREFNFIRVNRAYAVAGNKTVGEFPGRNHFELYPSDALPIFAEVVRSGRPFQTSARPFVYVDQPERGTTYWDWTLVPILDGQGQVEFLVFSLVEVTERKKREEEREVLLGRIAGVNLLQRSLLAPASQEEKLKSITDGIVRYFGADFCRIWLIRPGDLCERGCIHAEAEEGPHRCRRRDLCLHLLASSGRYTHTDGRGHRRVPFGCYKIGQIAAGEDYKFLTNEAANDPHIHDHEWARDLGLVSFAGYQLRVPDGRPLGVLALFARQPISADDDSLLDGLSSTVAMVIQQGAAEAALKRSEALNREILASVDEAFVVIDLEFRILTANRAYCEQSGKSLEEIIGRHCYEISHQATEPCRESDLVCGCRQIMETGKSSVVTHTHFDGGGQPRQVEIKTFAMRNEAGEVTSFIEVINDITEQNRLEAQLRQAQKMEAIGTLAGGIAHDFNNILTAILGYGEMVMEGIGADEALRADMAQVLKGGERARELVRQILAFSRGLEQQAQPLLVQFVIKEALKLLRASIPARIEIREEIDVGCGLVLADPVQIHQVVMNLCTNAYQAMRETGGVLVVSLEMVTIQEETAKMTADLNPGQYVCLAVTDTGCGMDQGVRERIFEPYFTTKGQREGTGLGLSLVHGIVSSLSGAISVYSEPGRGSTFKVYLPLIIGEGGDEPEMKRETAPGGHEALLVVDDEEFITRLECRILEGLGYQVTAFGDGVQALEAFRDNPQAYALLLTDMNMPQMNGDELAREVLRLRPDLPIIICTGFSELIDAEKAKAIGIRELLAKPLSKLELALAVRRALDGVGQG